MSVLYRARSLKDPSPYLQANKCSDTRKTGLYFSDDPRLCLGMAVENRAAIVLCAFQTVCPIKLFRGKYSFRDIHPERYFKPDGKMILHVEPYKSENISHFDPHMVPIFKKSHDLFDYGEGDGAFMGEIFVADTDLQSLRFIDQRDVSLKEARTILGA